MSAPVIVHLEVPFKVSTVGCYVNAACGAYVSVQRRTAYRAKVTCRGCKRTRQFAQPDPAVTP